MLMDRSVQTAALTEQYKALQAHQPMESEFPNSNKFIACCCIPFFFLNFKTSFKFIQKQRSFSDQKLKHEIVFLSLRVSVVGG